MALDSIPALFSCTLLRFQDGHDPAVATFLPGKAGSGKGKGCIVSAFVLLGWGRSDGEWMSVLRGRKFRDPRNN